MGSTSGWHTKAKARIGMVYAACITQWITAHQLQCSMAKTPVCYHVNSHYYLYQYNEYYCHYHNYNHYYLLLLIPLQPLLCLWRHQWLILQWPHPVPPLLQPVLISLLLLLVLLLQSLHIITITTAPTNTNPICSRILIKFSILGATIQAHLTCGVRVMSSALQVLLCM